MLTAVHELESVIWSIADGRASPDDLERFNADHDVSLFVIDRLSADVEDQIAQATIDLPADIRDQVLADLTSELRSLQLTAAIISGPRAGDIPGEARLQASWANGKIVVWAGGPSAPPEANAELADRLEQIGGPPNDWVVHPGITMTTGLYAGRTAEALAIPLKEALGWLVAVGGGQGGEGVGASVLWLGRVALEGVRLVAAGSIVPALRVTKRTDNRTVDTSVRWVPALLDQQLVRQLAAAMPGPVGAVVAGDAMATTLGVIEAVVEAIVAESVARLELPATPPSANSSIDFADSLIARLGGEPFRAQAGMAAEVGRRLERWSRTATSSTRPRLVIQLDPPASGGIWLLSVLAPSASGPLMPIDMALKADGGTARLSDEWARLERVMPMLRRSSGPKLGQVVLSQDEAWDLMTVTGHTLRAVGFDVRVPALSRRKATPALRLFADMPADSVVGAHQLSNVRWSVLFDDVELTAAEVARLASQARPLVQSRGKWIEVDRVDLKEAAAALAEREKVTRLTGAEILRHGIGLEGSALAGGIVVEGSGWATDLMDRAAQVSTEAVSRPEGFTGELRSYQAEALGWLAFLDAAALGGCLALDMGLGKTPTVLAHLGRTKGNGPALVIAPPAVVGNWAREAARFTPGLRVLVHHGATRAEHEVLARQIDKADLVITTYATAVRDVEELSERTWDRVVLDEAQAIKNSANETSQQLRRLPARTRLALTGTPVENGLGDLWSILDFTNPGLVGTRPAFIAQMSGDGEAALRALNGILLFRRTKMEPEVAAELPDKIDELDHCTMTTEQIGLYQAVLDTLVADVSNVTADPKQGAILAAITALKQICNHPAAYRDDGQPLAGRSGKLARLEEIIESVFAAGERILIFTHFASWGRRLADHLTAVTGKRIQCYDGSLARGARDKMVSDFQAGTGAGALVLSLKAGGTGLNLTSANHVVLYDRWWNPAVEDQARDRAWRIGQNQTVVSHRLVCPGTVDERVEEVVEGKRHIANLVLPKSSSLSDLNTDQLRLALGLRPDALLAEEVDG